MPAARLRIFSDLHFRDPRGALHDTAHFAPLLGDAESIVLNGDSVETQIPALARHAPELRNFAARSGRDFTWLSGNHDPDISEHADLLLCDERVWVTHGDVFFEAIAPWSHHAAELRDRFAAASAALPAGETPEAVATRLRLHRQICQSLPDPTHLFRPGVAACVQRFVHTLFPPRRIVEMLRAWQSTPRLVAELARAQRPRAQVVVLGHTHFPGVWTVPARRAGEHPLTVINTGSFTRPFGACFVELEGERLRVVRIRRDGIGFREGRAMGEIALQKQSA